MTMTDPALAPPAKARLTFSAHARQVAAPGIQAGSDPSAGQVARSAASGQLWSGQHALVLQPRHALYGGSLRAAEASLWSGLATGSADAPADAKDALHLCGGLLRLACAEAQRWVVLPFLSPARPAPLRVAVDLPAGALGERALFVQLHAALRNSGLSPSRLELGVPEAAVRDGGTETLLALSAMRDLDIGVALSAFAGSPASMRLLWRLPLTAIKLAGHLTAGLAHDRDARAAAGAAIGLAHALDISVVACGVETAEQRIILDDLGCDHMQGPAVAPIMLAEDFRRSLEQPLAF
jgi:EAL domain-containing protein (putative c-di-GMP-specific phosphodiesterase class I)